MLRIAGAADLENLIRLRRAAHGGTREDAQGWLLNVAGLENIFLLEKPDGTPLLMLAAVPVRYVERAGVWLTGLAAEPGVDTASVLPKLLAGCLRAFGAKGFDFAVALPGKTAPAGSLSELGFRELLPLRALQKPIRRDLLALAQFDSLTVRRLLDMRLRFQPGCVCLPEPAMNEVLTQLYRRGLTIVSDKCGYGLFYTQEDTLQFLELQAENDRCADRLLQAAREKTGVENARILLAESQTLYLGAGRRCGYGMIAFLHGEFSVTDMYFRMLL